MARDISRFIKDCDHQIQIVWGGPHPTVAVDETLSLPDVDFACVGEGLEALPELLNALEAGKDPTRIRNICAKRNGARSCETSFGRCIQTSILFRTLTGIYTIRGSSSNRSTARKSFAVILWPTGGARITVPIASTALCVITLSGGCAAFLLNVPYRELKFHKDRYGIHQL